jgi:hypothetical protein
VVLERAYSFSLTSVIFVSSLWGLGLEGLGLRCLTVVSLVHYSVVQSVVLAQPHSQFSGVQNVVLALALALPVSLRVAFSFSGLMGLFLCK